MRAGWAMIALLMAGCASGGGGWVAAGADESAASRDYQECRDIAQTAVRTDADIDQDIIATRQRDWQRSNIVRLGGRTMQEQTSDRAAAIVQSCMRAKGYTRAR